MPEYLYRCPIHDVFSRTFPMGAAPPTVLCGICKRESVRVYHVVSIQYHSPGFTRSLPDRPDERLTKEIKHSMDFDSVTGKPWEQIDRENERKKGHFGERLRKDIHLPAKGA